MDDIWKVLNGATLLLLLVCIGVIVHTGVRWLTQSRENFQWDKLMNLLWMLAIIFGLAEIFVQGSAPRGSRFLVIFVVTILQAYVVIRHYKDEPRVR